MTQPGPSTQAAGPSRPRRLNFALHTRPTEDEAPTPAMNAPGQPAEPRRAQPIRRHMTTVFLRPDKDALVIRPFNNSDSDDSDEDPKPRTDNPGPEGKGKSPPASPKPLPDEAKQAGDGECDEDEDEGSAEDEEDGGITFFSLPVQDCPSPVDDYSPPPEPQYVPFELMKTPTPPPELQEEMQQMRAQALANAPKHTPSVDSTPPRTTPPLFSPRYPPSPTLLERFPDTWLDEMLVSVERRRNNTLSEITDARADVSEALTESMKAMIMVQDLLGHDGVQGLIEVLEEEDNEKGRKRKSKQKENVDAKLTAKERRAAAEFEKKKGSCLSLLRLLVQMIGWTMVKRMLEDARELAESYGDDMDAASDGDDGGDDGEEGGNDDEGGDIGDDNAPGHGREHESDDGDDEREDSEDDDNDNSGPDTEEHSQNINGGNVEVLQSPSRNTVQSTMEANDASPTTLPSWVQHVDDDSDESISLDDLPELAYPEDGPLLLPTPTKPLLEPLSYFAYPSAPAFLTPYGSSETSQRPSSPPRKRTREDEEELEMFQQMTYTPQSPRAAKVARTQMNPLHRTRVL
ncbi:hypothetical protein ONZ45_g3829 [Pleurotus djamor]|nr:hypothetical protein ONZ45_g3829 [Pleurotus djamor]